MSNRTCRRIPDRVNPERVIGGLLAAAALALLAACSNTTVIKEPLTPQGVNKVGDRISDQAIAADRAYIDSLRGRLKKLNDAGRPLDEYSMCKAQAWVDFAFTEYTDNDRGGIVEQALGEAKMLIEKMEAGGAYGYSDTPVLEDSQRLREDLWTFVADTKAKFPISTDSKKPGCVDCALAKLEVQLVWIGNEYKDLGWRHADSAIRAAERFRNDVVTAADHCPSNEPPAPLQCPTVSCPVLPEGRKSPIANEVPKGRDPIKIPILVHFAYKKIVIAKESEPILDMIALVLTNNPQTTLELVGHADTRGTDKQNAWLSKNRAAAVQKYLVGKGISSKRLKSHGEGALAVATDSGISQIEAYARARRVDFIFTNLPDIETEKQLLDLQPDH